MKDLNVCSLCSYFGKKTLKVKLIKLTEWKRNKYFSIAMETFCYAFIKNCYESLSIISIIEYGLLQGIFVKEMIEVRYSYYQM